MILKYFSSNLYIQISKDKISVRNVDRNIQNEEYSVEKFTSSRLLVASFTNAMKLMKELVNKSKTTWFKPNIVIHPLEMIEGGLSEIEERILKELAASAGARCVFLHTGKILSDSEVVNIIKSYNNTFNRDVLKHAR